MAVPDALVAKFQLNHTQLMETVDLLCEKIKQGLLEDGHEIKAIPSYLQQPPEHLQGEVLVVDIGGTNVRAAIVKLNANGTYELVAGPIKSQVPAGRHGKYVSAEEFFSIQASLALQLNPAPNLPIGYCFSYAAQSTPEADASLIHWTKDVHVDGVEGQLVGKMLVQAFKDQGYQPGRITVLNDTVATLLAGAGANSHKYDHFIGLIAGTGTNMAGFVPISPENKLSKLQWNGEPMAVNLESGNFTPPYLNIYDDFMDQRLDTPGSHRFEKALAGYYLPFLYAAVRPGETNFDPYAGTGVLVAKRDNDHDELSEAILTRSAQYIAVSLAGFIHALGNEGSFCITAEGSRYWQDPQLAPYVEKLLPTLIGDKVTFSIVKVQDANLLGASYAALGR
ncbi:hypothetical protein IJT10_05230 [bacterium]|nr:hypothetical protein [bacterium]